LAPLVKLPAPAAARNFLVAANFDGVTAGAGVDSLPALPKNGKVFVQTISV
jgi:hypothetical protein